jgi:quercetin dioxygenase-like cupin family protein
MQPCFWHLPFSAEPGLGTVADTIFPRGIKIANNNFTGTAYLQMLIAADSLNPTAVGNVTFEPGSRTKWHLHPGGQILLVTDGVGYYLEKGKPKKYFVKEMWSNHKGSTVWLEAVTGDQYKD